MATTLPNATVVQRRFPRVIRRVAWLQSQRAFVAILAVVSIVAVFTVDMAVSGLPIAGFYVIPVLLVAVALRERTAALVTLLCLVLALFVIRRQEGITVEHLFFVVFGLFSAGGFIALAHLFNQVERVSARALLRAQLAEAVASIIELSSSRADLDELLQYTVEHIGEQIEAESGVLLLLRDGEWCGAAGYGFGTDAREVRLPLARFALAVEALEADRAVLVDDATRDPRVTPQDAELLGLHHVIVLPLRAFAADVGVIVLGRTLPPATLSNEQLRFAESVAGHAAVAIENARLMAELEAKRRDLSLVVESSLTFASSLDLHDVLGSVVMRLVEVLRAEECDVSVLRDGDATLHIVASFGSAEGDLAGRTFPLERYHATGEALRTARPVVIDHPGDRRLSDEERLIMHDHGHACELIVPLKARDRVVGAAELFANDAGRRFTDEEVDLAVAIAQFAALAIDNAQLYAAERLSRERLEALTTRLQSLQEVSLALNRLLDPQAILDEIVHAGALLLDAPLAAAVSRDGQALRLEASHVPAQLAGAEGEADSGKGWLMGLPVLLRGYSGAESDADRGAKRLLVVPLASDQLRLGNALVFARMEDQPEFTREDQTIAVTLGAHLSVSVDRAIAYQREHEFADTFQTALLVKPPVMPGIDVGVCYQPAYEAFRVGGDFYDLVKLGEGRLMVVLGDVCGKGLGAAAHSAMVRYMLRAYAAESSPGESLSRLNGALISEEADAPYTTLVIAYLDVVRHMLEYAVAGHPRPLVLSGGHEFPIGKDGSFPVGVFGTFYPTNRAVLPEDSTIVFYTDGVTEARKGQRMFGEQRLLEAAREGLHLSPRAAAEHVVERVKRHARDLKDDVAVVVVKLP